MRKCCETCNFSYLPGLIEEVQNLGNRMESSLYDKMDVEDYTKQRAELKTEVKALRQERDDLKAELGKDDDDGDTVESY